MFPFANSDASRFLPRDIAKIVQSFVPKDYKSFHPSTVVSIDTDEKYIEHKYNNVVHFKGNYIRDVKFLQNSPLKTFSSQCFNNESIRYLTNSALEKIVLPRYNANGLETLNLSKLKIVKLDCYTKPLDFLENSPVQSIIVYNFDHSFEFLRNSPVENINAISYTGTLNFLENNDTLETLILCDFNNSIEPLSSIASFRHLELGSFTYSLEPLYYSHIEILRIAQYSGDLEYLSECYYLSELEICDYEGSIEPVQHLDCRIVT